MKLQEKKFRKLQSRVFAKSDFYNRYAASNLTDIPVVTKKEYIENFNKINTAGLDKNTAFDIAIAADQSRNHTQEYKGYSVGLSSGTSGNRGIYILSENERSQWAGYIIGKMLPFRLQKEKLAFFLRANNKLYEASHGRLIEYRFLDLFNGVEEQVADLELYSPSILIAPANVLIKLVRLAVKISPWKIISVAEVLDDRDRQLISAYFNVEVAEIYQCTEGFLGATCIHGNMHLNEDAYLIEKQWIDKSTGRFHPVVTDLGRSTLPVVRYLLDDILVEHGVPCECGFESTRLVKIEGRADDVLVFTDGYGELRDVFPDYIRNAIISSSELIEEYSVTQINPLQLDVHLVPCTKEMMAAVEGGLNRLFARLQLIAPIYRFAAFERTAWDGKFRRVKNEFSRRGGNAV